MKVTMKVATSRAAKKVHSYLKKLKVGHLPFLRVESFPGKVDDDDDDPSRAPTAIFFY